MREYERRIRDHLDPDWRARRRERRIRLLKRTLWLTFWLMVVACETPTEPEVQTSRDTIRLLTDLHPSDTVRLRTCFDEIIIRPGGRDTSRLCVMGRHRVERPTLLLPDG